MSWNPEIEALLARKHENGGPFWSRSDGNIHAPAGFSTIDVMHAIGQLGGSVPGNADLKDSVAFVEAYQNDDGSFSYSKKKSRMPCVTANILSACGRLGVSGSQRADAAYALKWSGKTGQRAKMYPTLKTGYTNDEKTQFFG